MCDGKPHDIHHSKDSNEDAHVVAFSRADSPLLLQCRIVRVGVVADRTDGFDDLREFDLFGVEEHLGFVVSVVDGGFKDTGCFVEHLLIEPDTGTAVYPLDDQMDLVEPILVYFDIFVFEALQIETLQTIVLLCCGLQGGIAQFVIETAQTLFIEEMVDALTPITAKVECMLSMGFGDHHIFGKFQMTMCTRYLFHSLTL